MAGFRLKKHFAGKYVVLTADDEQVFGPARKAECEAYMGEAAPVVTSSRLPGEATPEQIRAWDRKVTAALAVPLSEEEAEIRAILEKRRRQDEVEYLIRQFHPLLLAGIEGGRRERYRPPITATA